MKDVESLGLHGRQALPGVYARLPRRQSLADLQSQAEPGTEYVSGYCMNFKRLLLSAVAWLGLTAAAQAGVRIKDITDLEGARGNQLVGFGLVVGLEGTGSKQSFTQQVAVDMLQRFYVSSKTVATERGDNVFKSGNISAVMVTAELGPFNRKGEPHRRHGVGPRRRHQPQRRPAHLHAAQGGRQRRLRRRPGPGLRRRLSRSASPAAAAPRRPAQKNHPTVGRIPGGAIVECEVRGNILCNGQIRLLLRDPDYVTARGIAKAINDRFGDAAVTVDAGTVQVFVPDEHANKLVAFVGDVGVLEVNPDSPARVVINERTGTVVAGQNVRISTVAVTHGNLAIVNEQRAGGVAAVALQPWRQDRGGAAGPGRHRGARAARCRCWIER